MCCGLLWDKSWLLVQKAIAMAMARVLRTGMLAMV